MNEQDSIDVEVLHKKPNIYDVLHNKFGVEWDNGIIITVYPYVYCKFELPPDKIVHESIHLRQQKAMTPQIWWQKFLDDPSFRLEQEVEAHRREAQFIRKNIKDRNAAFHYVREIAQNLSSKIYGELVTYSEAMALLK